MLSLVAWRWRTGLSASLSKQHLRNLALQQVGLIPSQEDSYIVQIQLIKLLVMPHWQVACSLLQTQSRQAA